MHKNKIQLPQPVNPLPPGLKAIDQFSRDISNFELFI